MGLISKITKVVEIPGEPSEWLEIRQLGWVTLEKAKTQRLAALIQMNDVLGALREAIKNGGAVVQEAKAAAAKDPFQQYDQLTLLRHGVAGWSYKADVDVELLDEKTAEWAARQILAYTLPGEAEVKASSSLGTGS